MNTRQPSSLFAPLAAIAPIAGHGRVLPACLSLGLLPLLLRAPRA